MKRLLVKNIFLALVFCFGLTLFTFDKADASGIVTPDAYRTAKVVDTYIRQYDSFNYKGVEIDHTYTTIYYRDRYTYYETSEDITTWAQKLMGMRVYKIKRHYTTDLMTQYSLSQY